MVDIITDFLRTLLLDAGNIVILLFELTALAVILSAGIKGLFHVFHKDDNTALDILKGFSVGLSFLLGGEILKTVILHDAEELIIVAGVVILRVSLSLLIYWELQHEKRELELAKHNHDFEKHIENSKKTS